MTDLLNPAPRSVVADLARRLSGPDGLAPLSARRLSLLIELMDEAGYIGYAAAYSWLFPDSDRSPAEKTRADKAFHKFRQTLREAAAMHKTHLELQLDANRNADPAQRRFWFAAADDPGERIAEYSRTATQAVTGFPQQDQRATVQGAELTCLLVYAGQDQEPARTLIEALSAWLRAAGHHWDLRDYGYVPPGELIDEAKLRQQRSADLTLFLLSPELISDLRSDRDFRTDRPLIPLALRPIKDTHLKDTILEGRAVFRDQQRKVWVERQGNRRDHWADQAIKDILQRIRLPDPNPYQIFADPPLRQSDDCRPEHYVDLILKGHADSEGREALGLLDDWLADPKGSVFCAIFGELGMGKTTLCQRLTRDLLDRRVEDPRLPLPVYLDLREVNSLDWDWSHGVPDLERMLDHILATAFNLPVDHPRPGVDDIRRLAQQHGGLVIFDGLDEVMNRLTPEHCRRFIGQLWSILPPAVYRPEAGPRPTGVGRLIMTCRSHFFQTLQEQLDTLSGRRRESVGRRDYLWADLLPFDADQIETYFRQVFGDDPRQAQQVLEMLDEVHDLRELGSRPYNLRLIQDQIEGIEAIHRQGGRVGVADLYEGLVQDWTRRDSPKHRLDRDHKLLLMEYLAHRLWSFRQKTLDYRDLEKWLRGQLAADPETPLQYGAYLNREGGLDILQEDLRNATFLVREGEDRFRFAHTSIMEFFLARALFRALLEIGGQGGDSASTADQAPDPEQTLAAWKIPIPSPETLDFLGELLRKRDQAVWQAAFRTIRERYRQGISELALAYGLHAHRHGFPAPSLVGMDLAGADFKDWRFEGPNDGPLLNLSHIRLAGCRLMNARFRRVNLNHADLTGADLTRAELWGGKARGLCLRDTDLTGARLRGLDLTGADLRAEHRYRTQLLGCVLDQTLGDRALGRGGVSMLTADCRSREHPSPFPSQSPAIGALAQVFEGHQGRVRACAWSPDGDRLVSAGDDRTLRLWDAAAEKTLTVIHPLPDREHAILEPDGSGFRSASPGAWRRLGWQVRDPETGRIERLPAETFGPIPGMDP